MKTLIFPSEFTDNRGGVPQSTISIVSGLALLSDFKIIVICPYGSEMSKVKFPSKVIVCTTNKSEWIVSKKSIWNTFTTVVDLYTTMYPFLGSDTWVITNQPVTSSLLSFFPFRHIKEIYINRGGDFQDKGVASYLIARKLSKHCIDYAVGVSKRQVQLLKTYGMPVDRLFLIHNGLPLPSIPYEFRALSTDCLRISTIGFISDLKNQIEGIRLIKLLRDQGVNAVLNIYGDPDGDKEYLQLLFDEIQSLSLKSYIQFFGFVSGEDLFLQTDMLISFSRSEGFGRSLVEAILRKKPVIAWRGAGGPVDITNDGQYGHLVDNNVASDYFQVVMRLLSSPNYNKQNVEDAYHFALQHFTVDSMINKYIQLINNVCK